MGDFQVRRCWRFIAQPINCMHRSSFGRASEGPELALAILTRLPDLCRAVSSLVPIVACGGAG